MLSWKCLRFWCEFHWRLLLFSQSWHQTHWWKSPDLSTVFACLSLPPTAARSISQLAEFLRRSDVRLAMFDVRQSTDGRHAGLQESDFLLCRQHYHDSIVKLSKNRSVGSSRMDVVIRESWHQLNTMHHRTNWQRSEWVSVAVFRSHRNSRNEARCLNQVASFHVLRCENVLQLITDSYQRYIGCSTTALDDLHHFLDLNFAFSRWSIALPLHPVIPTMDCANINKLFRFPINYLLVFYATAKSLHHLSTRHRITTS